MKELWTAQVHLLTPPVEFGDTKCFTNVVAWADGPEDYRATITPVLEKRHWSILRVQQCKRVSDCTGVIVEHAEQIEQARQKPGSCVYGTLHYYPSKPA
jgi:hypothetical protein